MVQFYLASDNNPFTLFSASNSAIAMRMIVLQHIVIGYYTEAVTCFAGKCSAANAMK